MKDPEEDHMKTMKLNFHKPMERRRRNRRRGRQASKPDKLQDTCFDLELSSSASSKSLVFHRRPGYGQLGTKCLVKANHFLADISVSDLTHYNVSFLV